MKTIKILVVICYYLTNTFLLFAQNKEDIQIIKQEGKFELDKKQTRSLAEILVDIENRRLNYKLYSYLKDNIDSFNFKTKKNEIFNISKKEIEQDKMVIFFNYHPLSIKNENDTLLISEDASQINTIIINNKNDSLTNYVRNNNKNITVFEVSFPEEYYRKHKLTSKTNNEDLSKSIIKIIYYDNLFKTSLREIFSIYKEAKGEENTNTSENLCLTIKRIDSKYIKAPCLIIDTLESKKTVSKLMIHELNWIKFNVGINNTNYKLNNFSISNGNLIVKPDTSQTKSWKSNLFVALELHWPRDIDNFQPLWKTILKFKDGPYEYRNGKGKGLWNWFYNNTIDRIGVYGGMSISNDPLSTLHAGFNYAITKDFYFNMGWTWTNEIAPQVTAIGNITSLSDAEAYAKRKYSKPQFSWGLSFSPSIVINMFKK